MNKIALFLIHFYRYTFSIPLGKLGIRFCLYEPTCSEYGLQCFRKFNFFKALYLTSYRIIRCNPMNEGGYDPVPEK